MRTKMRHADPGELEKLVEEIVGRSPLAKEFVDAAIALGEFDDKSDFIRVLLRLNHLDSLSAGDVDAIVADIERGIAERDDRFPSIRFTEP